MVRSTLRCPYCRRAATTVVRASGGTGELLSTSFAICDRDTCRTKWTALAAGFATSSEEHIPEPATDTGPTDTPDQPSLF